MKRVFALTPVLTVALLMPITASAELRRVEMKTLGMD